MKSRLSISYYEKNIFRKYIYIFIEYLVGLRHIQVIYESENKKGNLRHQFWLKALRAFNIKTEIKEGSIASIPSEGKIIIVCNHPYGMVDGWIVAYLVSSLRDDYMIVANSILKRVPEIEDKILPLDLQTIKNNDERIDNKKSIKQAYDHINNEGALIIFPSGEVSTANNIFGKATDPKWSNLAVKIAKKNDCDILPIYFHGKNSFLFHIVSKISFKLRKFLFFREAIKLSNKIIYLNIREKIKKNIFKELNADEATKYVRSKTEGL